MGTHAEPIFLLCRKADTWSTKNHEAPASGDRTLQRLDTWNSSSRVSITLVPLSSSSCDGSRIAPRRGLAVSPSEHTRHVDEVAAMEDSLMIRVGNHCLLSPLLQPSAGNSPEDDHPLDELLSLFSLPGDGVAPRGGHVKFVEPNWGRVLRDREQIVSVACGLEHALFCTSSGQLFASGKNSHGELGTGRLRDESLPAPVQCGKGTKVLRVYAGYGCSFAIVTDSARPLLSLCSGNEPGELLYAWGNNKYGQLGIGTTQNALTPAEVERPPGVTSWKSVAGGFGHTAVVASGGNVYTFGLNLHGQLGLSTTGQEDKPKLVPIPAAIRQVSCGPWQTLFLTEDGKVLTAGCAPRFKSAPSLHEFQDCGDAVRSRQPSRGLAIENLRDTEPSPKVRETSATAGTGHCPFASVPGVCRLTGLPGRITCVSAGSRVNAAIGENCTTGTVLCTWRVDGLPWRLHGVSHSMDVHLLEGEGTPLRCHSTVGAGSRLRCHSGASRVILWSTEVCDIVS
ncbi:e3 isg15--protein ligase herc5 [Cystoisospora suis]|uniref:E3 isg15--protein ligase herc5 n=1 Tax=Cystoisospora suis TaxID=483139 RepID=A0A2C6L6G2_9APIC|nr:e3 isg15--protein ligase herc5 [Cystoisospora suis]